MKYTPPLFKPELPTESQYASYRSAHALLRLHPDALTPEQQREFCELTLCVDPDLLDMAAVQLVEKLCPELWKDYSRCHWGYAQVE